MPADSGDRPTGTQRLERPATTPPDESEDRPTAAVPGDTAHGDAAGDDAADDVVVEGAVADHTADDTADGAVVEDTADDAVVEDTADDAVVEDAVVDDTADDAVVEGAVVEGAVVDGAADGAVVDESVVDDAVVDDAVVDDTAGDAVVDDTADDAVVDDTADGAVVDDTADDTADGAVVDDTADDAVVEDAVVDDTADGAVVDDTADDTADGAVVDDTADDTADGAVVDGRADHGVADHGVADHAVADHGMADGAVVDDTADGAVVDDTADDTADGAVVDDTADDTADGAVVDGRADHGVADHGVADGAVVDGAVVDGAVVDDTADDAVVDGAVVDDTADHSVADHSVADHAVADHAVADHAVADHAVADHAVADHAVADHAVADHAVVDDAVVDGTAGEGGEGTRSRWPWVLAGSLVLLAVVYAGAAWAVSGRVPAGVSVGGSEIGGSSRAAAVETLTADLGPRSEEPVALTVGSETAQLDPATSGLDLDLEGTVDELVGFSLDPRDVWRHLGGSSDVAPVVSVDEPALTDALETVAGEVESEPVAGAVTFTDGAAVATPAMEGRALDVAGATDVVVEEWLTAPAPAPAIELPADVVAPEVDQAAVDEALASFATPATSGPLTVAVPGRTVALEPAEFAPTLAMEAVEGRLEPRLDGAALLAAVLAKDPGIVTAPQDATVRLEGGGPVVVPAVNGTGIDPDALAEVALPALTAPERTAEVEPVPAEPEVTTADAEALGVREPVSEFATKLTPDAGRTENITIAAGTVNGTLLLPGETFSLNDTLGRRTPEKGYNEAPVIVDGRLTRDFGGGVSQMATTLFNGMFFAGLEDIEHKPHSFYISRYPEGREATVNFDNVDLEFRNDSPYGVLIEAYVGGGQVHTRFWSTRVWEEIRADKSARSNISQPESITDPSPECVSQEAQVGFDVSVTRSFVRGGAVERTEEFNTRYNAEDEVRCTG